MATKVRELLEISIDESGMPQELRPTFGKEKWRSSIVVALGNMGRAAAIAIPKLQTLFYDNECAVRIFAARAVWQITEDPRLVVPVLKNVLRDGAVQPTFEFDWGYGIPDPLAWTYRTERSPAFYRTDELNCQEAAAYLLGEIGPEAKEAMSVLEAAPVVEDTLFQLLLARARCRIGKNNAVFLSLLLNKLDARVGLKPICVPAAYFLGELGADAESAIPKLDELLKDENPAIRTTAEHALMRIRRAIVERENR
jgi:HEAT repeat protein